MTPGKKRTDVNCFSTVLSCLAVLTLSACSGFHIVPSPTPTAPPLARELILYNWPDYMPQTVLDAFEKEYGTKVMVHTYESQDDAFKNITNHAVTYDVAVIEYDLLPSLIGRNLLAKIDFQNIPNFENISADFRDLAYDPGNQHSVPYNWGTSGLLVRSDLIQVPVTKWADLWDPRYAGKIGIHNEPTEIISIALRSLGYPLNSEDPAQLEAASRHLLQLKKSIVFVPADLDGYLNELYSGQIVIPQGWNGDALAARKENPAIKYILPEEGTMLWGGNFVISSSSPNRYTAEIFINFLLRPEISAQIVEAYNYPTANEAARQFIDPTILNDPVVYPPRDYLTANSFYTPLSEKGQKLYDNIWERFMQGNP